MSQNNKIDHRVILRIVAWPLVILLWLDIPSVWSLAAAIFPLSACLLLFTLFDAIYWVEVLHKKFAN